jgi:hypothetical protein
MGNVAAVLGPLGCELSAIDIDALRMPAKGDAHDWLADRPEASLHDLLALPKAQPRPLNQTRLRADPGPSWPSLDDAARYGLLASCSPPRLSHTGGDAAAVLVQLLTAFGIYVGRKLLCAGRGR